MDSQCLFWESMNDTLAKHGCDPADFFGFMADEAQANWNAVRQVFNGGKSNAMEGRERSCLFQWKQSLNQHTTKYIVAPSHATHKNMCEKWRQAQSKEAAEAEARLIRQWWRLGNCNDKNLPYMDSWLSWWEVRIAHWGSVMIPVESSLEGANTPRTNLAESKHGSWLAGEGFKRRISLYDACTTDLANAVLQSTKAISFMQGKHLGKGPSLQRLTERMSNRPTHVVRVVNEATEGTPCYRAPSNLAGNKETSRKKRLPTEVVDVEDDSTHRPEFNSVTKDRRPGGRPRKINFAPEGLETSPISMNEFSDKVVERWINEAMWAIRRTRPGSKVTCSGTSNGGRRCCKSIARSTIGVSAPSFEGYRRHPRGLIRQWFWFCPDHILHCHILDNNIDTKPGVVPMTWPVRYKYTTLFLENAHIPQWICKVVFFFMVVEVYSDCSMQF